MHGAGTIECASLWLTGTGCYIAGTCDVYLWEGGVSQAPGAVLMVTTDIDPGMPAMWPDVSQHDIDLPDFAFSGGEFTVGYWGNWPGMFWIWFVGADLDGPGGHSWTCLSPGSSYGTGWVDPEVVWGPTQSLGLGFYYGDAVPVESPTWGRLRALFRPR